MEEARIRSNVLVRRSSHDVTPKAEGTTVQWVALIVLALCPIGGYMSYDAPGALSIFYTNDLGLTLTQIGGLYTAYAVPCVLLSPFCGTLAYHFGSHRMMVAGNMLAVLASLGFAFATELWAMIMMRVVFGLGLEVLLVAGSLLIEEWFRSSKYLGVAFGLVESFPLIGTLIAFALLPEVAQRIDMKTALLVTLGVCLACACGSIVYYRLLHRRLKMENRAHQKVAAGNIFKLHMDTLKKAKIEFWLLCGFCFTLDSTGFPFLAMAGQFFYDKYGYSESYSTKLVCLFCIVAIVIGPMLNFAIDKTGRRVSISIFSSVMNVAAFLIFAFTDWHPANRFGLVIASLAYVIGCGTVYNLASRTASSEQEIGALFSILSIFPNLTFLVMPLIFGAMRDQTGTYLWGCLFFAIVDFGGFLCLLLLKRFDTCNLDSKNGYDLGILQPQI